MEIAIDTMTLPEKLRLMEALWADLSRNAEAMELPPWHAQALRETQSSGSLREKKPPRTGKPPKKNCASGSPRGPLAIEPLG